MKNICQRLLLPLFKCFVLMFFHMFFYVLFYEFWNVHVYCLSPLNSQNNVPLWISKIMTFLTLIDFQNIFHYFWKYFMKTLKEVEIFFVKPSWVNIKKCCKALLVNERFSFYFNKISSDILEIIFKFWSKFSYSMRYSFPKPRAKFETIPKVLILRQEF